MLQCRDFSFFSGRTLRVPCLTRGPLSLNIRHPNRAVTFAGSVQVCERLFGKTFAILPSSIIIHFTSNLFVGGGVDDDNEWIM